MDCRLLQRRCVYKAHYHAGFRALIYRGNRKATIQFSQVRILSNRITMLIETLVAALSVPLLTLGAAVIEQRQVQGRWCYDCVTPETVDCWYASVVHGKNITCEPPHPPVSAIPPILLYPLSLILIPPLPDLRQGAGATALRVRAATLVLRAV
jgi:hypothetical protein